MEITNYRVNVGCHCVDSRQMIASVSDIITLAEGEVVLKYLRKC